MRVSCKRGRPEMAYKELLKWRLTHPGGSINAWAKLNFKRFGYGSQASLSGSISQFVNKKCLSVTPRRDRLLNKYAIDRTNHSTREILGFGDTWEDAIQFAKQHPKPKEL